MPWRLAPSWTWRRHPLGTLSRPLSSLWPALSRRQPVCWLAVQLICAGCGLNYGSDWYLPWAWCCQFRWSAAGASADRVSQWCNHRCLVHRLPHCENVRCAGCHDCCGIGCANTSWCGSSSKHYPLELLRWGLSCCLRSVPVRLYPFALTAATEGMRTCSASKYPSCWSFHPGAAIAEIS